MRTREDILDELLVLRVQSGDLGSLESLARRWHPRLVRHAARLTGEREGGADVAQEAWLAIVRSIRRLQDPARFRAWAYRIVTRKSSDWIRSTVRRRRLNERAAQEPIVSSIEPPRPAASELERALSELEPKRRILLSMFYLEGMTVGEIAHALAIPPGTVKSRLFHIRNFLRAALEKES